MKGRLYTQDIIKISQLFLKDWGFHKKLTDRDIAIVIKAFVLSMNAAFKNNFDVTVHELGLFKVETKRNYRNPLTGEIIEKEKKVVKFTYKKHNSLNEKKKFVEQTLNNANHK